MMQTVISNMITVHDPSDEVREFAKGLRLPNPDYEKKQRMGFWVGRTPKEIRLYERDGDALVFPFGLLRELWPMIRIYPFECDFRQNEVIDYGEGVTGLYDYQEEAVNAMIEAKYGILKSPAGSGKTQIGVAMIGRLKRKALWLCHTADLLKQSRDRALQYMPEELTGTITEGKVNIGKGVTFATVQTMCNVDLDRYRHEWDVVIVDECHRISTSATTVSRYQKVLNNLAARHKYGLTATPARSDGLIKATFALIGGIAHEVPDSAVEDRVMKVTVQREDTGVGIDEACLNDDGTIDYVRLIGYLTTHHDRNARIAFTIAMTGLGHSCIVLSDRLNQLEEIMGMLPEAMQNDAALISGKMVSKKEKEERAQILDRMRTGELKYLFATYSLCREGLDIPRLDRLYMASPVKFSSVVIQSVGRIARVFPGKETPECFDFVDAIGYCERAWKERRRHYRKLGATIKEE